MNSNAVASELESKVAENETHTKDMLRFITCGSVDDGKSTLIGRLMLEAGAIPDDQIAALKHESQKHGTNGSELDTALLLDGLEDERQQGITIDVAYRYFTTKNRKFIIADTPGHEQFTRNMATGASTADLAIILVDAAKGISTQTKRHAFIVSLLGIKHVILAVNKMDLVEYSRETFEGICAEFRQFAAKLDIPDIRFIPLSALQGDNVTVPSANTLWYSDGSLLHLLETIYVGSDRNLKDLRFPVQWVNRPDSDFRGFAGTIASGTIRCGDELVVLPSKKKSRVRSIVTMNGELQEARSPLSVTLTLEDEIDISRGDMLVRPGNMPTVAREAEAMIVWMSDQPLASHKQYWFKGGNRRTSGEVTSIRYSVDVNTLHRQPASTLKINEIGRCQISTLDPMVFDPYQRNRETGAFILVDRITHETVAAGMFLDRGAGDELIETKGSFLEPRPVDSLISTKQRASQYCQQPFTLLITGLPAVGKTSLALEVEKLLYEQGRLGVLLDGEHLRTSLSNDLGYSAADRSENLRRAGMIAKLLNDSGQFCIAAFAAPETVARERFQEIIGDKRFLHVHLSAPVSVCRSRDTTGRYLAAEQGEISSFPGVSSDYETPEKADLILENSIESTSMATIAHQVLQLLRDKSLIPKK